MLTLGSQEVSEIFLDFSSFLIHFISKIGEDFQIETTHKEPPPPGEGEPNDSKGKKEVKKKNKRGPSTSKKQSSTSSKMTPLKATTPSNQPSSSSSILTRILQTPTTSQQSPRNSLSLENSIPLLISGEVPQQTLTTKEGKEDQEEEKEEQVLENIVEEGSHPDFLVSDQLSQFQ